MTDKNLDKEESYIPLLDGANYTEWHLRMRFLLRSRDLLDVCENSVGQDASTNAVNQWKKLSFEAITLITSQINQQVFLEVVKPETSNKANLLWSCINKHYALKRNMNKGRVWMNWQKLNYNNNLQSYINSTRKFLLDLQSVSIQLPPEILSYIILGKLGNESSLSQLIKKITSNDSLIEKPDQVLLWLQEYANLQSAKSIEKPSSSVSAVVASSEHQYKITHYCSNGNKRKIRESPAAAHLVTARALITSTVSQSNPSNQIVIDCGAMHHMFYSKNVFSSFSNVAKFSIATRDSSSNLLAEGMGSVIVMIGSKRLTLTDCLYVPKLNCNLVSLMQLFRDKLTITKRSDSFSLRTDNDVLFEGKIINNLMKINFSQPTSLLTTVVDDLWHKRLGHPGKAPVCSMGLPSDNSPCKIHQLLFKNKFEHVSLPLDCVHLDLVGPISPPSACDSRYFLTIVDQFTSYKITRMLKNKSDAFDQFVEVKNLMENHQQRTVKTVIF
ncbi:hypothetical protein O181_051358 [Austropuccinia psidii MF-1]|uniref:Retrovirus-related Pol polyprotein from transposon TNT 1-94-like beta-barrel domain-containing protein n=1 Tax=Austropuccinia psidii MF-1 TaxID=1389203 RepID=A0A9Q3HN99_9BASI|nr:hypothetical protein [Austropuccinia psidii MF-1]